MMKNGPMCALAASLLLFAVLGCGGGVCTADLTVDGSKHTGIAKDPEQARQNACSKYCIEGNLEFDLAHEKWLKTAEAQKVPDRESKWAAQAKSKELRAIVERCRIRCMASIENGSYKTTVECK